MAITLVIETGTGVSGANTYVSRADADVYLTNMYGTSEWSAAVTANNGTAESALYQACFAMERLYGRKYLSVPPYASQQSLLWPRYTFLDNNFRIVSNAQIPQCLKDAQCELALLNLQGVGLFPNESTNRLFKQVDVQAGDVKSNQQYWRIPENTETYDGFRKVELILYPVLVTQDNSKARLTL